MHQVETTFSQSVASSGRPWHFLSNQQAADPTMIHPTTRQHPLNSRRRGDHKKLSYQRTQPLTRPVCYLGLLRITSIQHGHDVMNCLE